MRNDDSAYTFRAACIANSLSDLGLALLAMAIAGCGANLLARSSDYPHGLAAVACTVEWTKHALVIVYLSRAMTPLREKAVVAIAALISTTSLCYCDVGMAVANARVQFFQVILWADAVLTGSVLLLLCVAAAPRRVRLAPPSTALRSDNRALGQFSLMRLQGAVFVSACLAYSASYLEIGITTSLRRASLLLAVTAPCGIATAIVSLAAFARRRAALYIIMSLIAIASVELAVPLASKDTIGPASGRYFAAQSSAVVTLAACFFMFFRGRGWRWIEAEADTNSAASGMRTGAAREDGDGKGA